MAYLLFIYFKPEHIEKQTLNSINGTSNKKRFCSPTLIEAAIFVIVSIGD